MQSPVGPGSECFIDHGLYAEAMQCSGSNSVLVGLRVFTNGWVRAVRGICSDSAQGWSTGVNTATYDLSTLGNTAGTSQSWAICPFGSFLAGWRIASGQFIDSIVPFCRRL